MIPKIIHYCWFGHNPLPPLAQQCIASWRRFLPDYEIWQWREKGLSHDLSRKEGDTNADKVMEFDVNCIPYTEEAYKQKKYAFVSDYARFWIMYHYGGIYFDTDVEVIRHMDDIIAKGNFMGFEVDPDGENTPGRYAPRYAFAVNPGLGFGMEARHQFINAMLDEYKDKTFEMYKDFAWYKTIVAYTTEKLCEEGLRNVDGIQEVQGITIYPHEYFAPINVMTGRLKVTANTRTIHRYMGSWGTGDNKSWKQRIRRFMPDWVFVLNNRIKRRKYKIHDKK